MVKKRPSTPGRKKRRPGRQNKATVAELLSTKGATTRKTRAKKTEKIIPDVLEENDKVSRRFKDSKKGTQIETDSSNENQKSVSSNLKSRTEIQGDVPSKIVYVSHSVEKSNNIKAIQLTSIGKQDKLLITGTDDEGKNAGSSQTRRIICIERKNSEIQPKNKSYRKQTIPPHYLNSSDDDMTPRWRGPLRNYSRVKAGNDVQSKSSDLTSAGNSTDKPRGKDSLLKNSGSETDASVPNFSEICEKLANAGSSITDSLSPNASAFHAVHSVEEKLSAHKTQMRKNNISSAVSQSKVSSSSKTKVSFIKPNILSSSSSPVQGSESGIKSNQLTVSPSSFDRLQMDSEKCNCATILSSSEKLASLASSSVPVKSGKTKSPVSKISTEPKVSKTPHVPIIYKDITVYPHSSLKKSAASKSSDSSAKHFTVSSSKKAMASNVENRGHEDSSISLSANKSSNQAAHGSDRHRTSSVKKPDKKTRKRSFEESDESMDCSLDANAAMTKYFADPDFHFLMSLMPFLKKMNLSDRLKARIKIQEIIYDVGNFER